MKKIIILFFLACINPACGQNSGYEILNLDGVVSYKFSKKGSVYWLRYVWYNSVDGAIEARMKPDFYNLKSIVQHCSDIVPGSKLEELETDNFRKQTLFYSPNYRDQSIRSNNPVHHGGDIYFSNDSTLVIAFNVKGKGVFFQEICDSYFESEKLKKEASIPCEYSENKIELPLIALIKYDTTYTLNQKQVRDMNLTAYNQDSFNIMWCE